MRTCIAITQKYFVCIVNLNCRIFSVVQLQAVQEDDISCASRFLNLLAEIRIIIFYLKQIPQVVYPLAFRSSKDSLEVE